MVKRFASLRSQLAAAILTVLALGLGLLLILAGQQMSRMTMEAFTHEQQVIALVLANTSAEAFEAPGARQLMRDWAARRDQWRSDIPPDTNVSMFDTRGALIANSGSPGASGLAVDLRAALSGRMISTIIGTRLYTAVP